MKISTSLKFYMLAAFIALIGVVDVFVVNAKKGGEPATDTAGTTDTAASTATDVAPCFGLRSIMIGYKPVASSDVNDPPSVFIRDVVESTLRSAGCEVKRSDDPAQLDLLIDTPAGVRKRVAENQWLETRPFAVVQLKTIGATPVEKLTNSQEIRIDGQWKTLIEEHYPGKKLVVSEHPVDDVVNLDPIHSAIVGKSGPDSSKTTHHPVEVDIPLTMALHPSHQQILEPLNRLLTSPDYAARFANARKVPDIVPPPRSIDRK